MPITTTKMTKTKTSMAKTSKMMKRWWLVIPGTLLLSAVTWGQSWGPRASVQVQFGAPVQYVQVDRHWDDDRRWEGRNWEARRYEARRWDRDREWRERERHEAWERNHRREEWREHHNYYRGY